MTLQRKIETVIRGLFPDYRRGIIWCTTFFITLHHHEKIADVYVVGVPDIKYGEELCAWVKMKPDQTMTEHEVKDFCKGNLAHFKIPRYVMFVDDSPMGVTGRIQMFRMRETSLKALGLHEADNIETA